MDGRIDGTTSTLCRKKEVIGCGDGGMMNTRMRMDVDARIRMSWNSNIWQKSPNESVRDVRRVERIDRNVRSDVGHPHPQTRRVFG